VAHRRFAHAANPSDIPQAATGWSSPRAAFPPLNVISIKAHLITKGKKKQLLVAVGGDVFAPGYASISMHWHSNTAVRRWRKHQGCRSGRRGKGGQVTGGKDPIPRSIPFLTHH
jgi:hypothetical protein